MDGALRRRRVRFPSASATSANTRYLEAEHQWFAQARVTTAAPAGLPCFSITNTGPVIPPGEVGRLLEPFQQLDGERTRRDGGQGLGLAIVSAVASAHDASLTVRARPEGGLDVTVMFRS